ncbi:MAG TPA: DUF1552 domain-containing protein [Vicinamibacterales bacterium]|nr:DUF1552 domain-containing protein [Vicinamibacterales bacterium]
MFISRLAIPRRTFLRGLGATIALPMLDAMVPALSAAPSATPRFTFLYVANGVIQDEWTPKTTGADYELTPILAPLAQHKKDITVVSGLAHLQADTFGDGTGDHPRASAAWLTGVHAYDRTLPGVDVKLATSADQILAQRIGKTTAVSSIELSVDYPTQGACDSGDCFYVNTVSWRNETTPNPTELHPRVVFERLFGDGGTAAERRARLRETGSILDSVGAEIRRLDASLGAGDSGKLDEYLDSVRDVEQRIQNAERHNAQNFELPDRPVDVPPTFEEHAKLMFDLQVLGFRADVTRVSSMILSRELSSMTFGQIGVPDQHHAVSHHRNDPDLIAKKAKIDAYQTQLLAYYLDKLTATPDGDGTLLDHSLVLYGGGMGNGNLHRHTDLPCLVAGRLGGAIKTGQHLAYPDKTPMTNLLLTILAAAGIPQEHLGDSTGRLQPNALSLG